MVVSDQGYLSVSGAMASTYGTEAYWLTAFVLTDSQIEQVPDFDPYGPQLQFEDPFGVLG